MDASFSHAIDVPPLQPAADDPIGEARRALRSAQVELYCDHDGKALAAIRAARSALAHSGRTEPEVQFLVEEAAWHLRHHERAQAQHVLADACQRLA